MGNKLRVGINGFGRIGRAVARQLLARDKVDLVAINDINPDKNNLAYMLKYDSQYGALPDAVGATEQGLRWNDREIAISHQAAIHEAAWPDVDVLIDASGTAQNVLHARALPPSVRNCFVTNAAKEVDYTLVFGVNQQGLDLKQHRVVSTSICDANACGPALAALDEACGISHGFITTLHPWLSYQNLLDGRPVSMSYPGATYEHYTLGRSSINSLIPKPTTVVSACEQVLPTLRDTLQCFSYRVPTSHVSSADMSLCLKRPTTKEEVIEIFGEWSKRCAPYRVFEICRDPLVSIDFLRNEHSAVVDARWLMVGGGTYVKIVLWYDNEWGYSSRVVDAVEAAAATWAS